MKGAPLRLGNFGDSTRDSLNICLVDAVISVFTLISMPKTYLRIVPFSLLYVERASSVQINGLQLSVRGIIEGSGTSSENICGR